MQASPKQPTSNQLIKQPIKQPTGNHHNVKYSSRGCRVSEVEVHWRA
jgi:hypothetical protein